MSAIEVSSSERPSSPSAANDRVLEAGSLGHALQLGVFHNQIRHEGLVQRQVDVLVDRRRDEETAVLPVI